MPTATPTSTRDTRATDPATGGEPATALPRDCAGCGRRDTDPHHVQSNLLSTAPAPSHHIGCCPEVCGRPVNRPTR